MFLPLTALMTARILTSRRERAAHLQRAGPSGGRLPDDPPARLATAFQVVRCTCRTKARTFRLLRSRVVADLTIKTVRGASYRSRMARAGITADRPPLTARFGGTRHRECSMGLVPPAESRVPAAAATTNVFCAS